MGEQTPLGRWMAQHNISTADAAHALGVSYWTIYRLQRGERMPRLPLARAILEWTWSQDRQGLTLADLII